MRAKRESGKVTTSAAATASVEAARTQTAEPACTEQKGLAAGGHSEGKAHCADVASDGLGTQGALGTQGTLPKPWRSLALSWLLRALLAAVFLYAGWSKLLRPDDFLQDILNYQLVGGQAALWVALLLPPLELLLALCLLLRATALPAALLVCGLCVAFTLALLSAWVRGLDIACGCFGASAPVSYPQTLLRDLLLITCAAWLAVMLAKSQARTGRQTSPQSCGSAARPRAAARRAP